jgi:hypothetical protein
MRFLRNLAACAALAFSIVVSMIPGSFFSKAACAIVALVAMGRVRQQLC